MNEKDFVRKDVYGAEQDTLLMLDEKTNQRIDDLKDTVNRQVNFWGITVSIIAGVFAAMQIGLAVVMYFLSRSAG
ncbi:MAG: hypothetical protein IJR85_04695 [Synergistaceae bacterium]|nr:hypothetical protein [Synergistaceae bacterium]